MPTFLTFCGRRKRLSYFLTWLVLIAVTLVVQFVVGFIVGAAGQGSPDTTVAVAQLLGGLLTLPLAWPFYAIGAQRLHDMGYSGWFQLLTLIPLVNLILFLIMIFAPSQAGANRYGPVPSAQYAAPERDAPFAASGI